MRADRIVTDTLSIPFQCPETIFLHVGFYHFYGCDFWHLQVPGHTQGACARL